MCTLYNYSSVWSSSILGVPIYPTVITACNLNMLGKHVTNLSMAQDQTVDMFKTPLLNGHHIFEITLTELQDHFALGHFSASAYVHFCLDRIRVTNPYLGAVIEVNPDADTIAKRLDDERLAGNIKGPLHGVPVLLKDNMATKDAMQTTAGSWSLLGSVVSKDAFIVSKLREAGAIIIGKTNMCEWACLRSKEYSTGYSPRGGQVRNPYDLRKSPHGSSSGSAVAVSANLIPLSFGTETDTSIIGPASSNGVVGIKPSVGLTSRSGVIPISRNMVRLPDRPQLECYHLPALSRAER